ncbi:MAG: RNA polymerase subunit sigma-70, partial [Acidobacteria bacterium]|nr:RNA polymerase subunit sigma-70 [Acidobacteriota bacterium]
MRPSPEVITSLVERVTAGEEQALSELLPVVYQELRKLSKKYMRRESNRQTLQTT